jgi:hypothetical protein
LEEWFVVENHDGTFRILPASAACQLGFFE